MTKIAVVILNWNGRKWLEQFLPSVVCYSTGDDVEIVVADNASTDDSIEFLVENYPDITHVILDQNYGYADGYNRALRQIEAEYFVLLNSDVEVTENWITPIIEYLDQNPDVVAAQPKILAQHTKEKFEYAGAAGGFIDRLGYPFCRGRIFTTLEADKGQYDDVVDVFWASGACMFIRSKDYFEVGGLDASFFAHMEEIDLCWRLNIRGRRIVCIPQSTVFHFGGGTLTEESPRKTFLNFRNNLLMLYKNMPDNNLRKVLFQRRLLDYLAAFQMLLSGKSKNAKAVLAARKEFKKIKSNYTKQRIDNLSHAFSSVSAALYERSILSEYYLKGHKTYDKLIKRK